MLRHCARTFTPFLVACLFAVLSAVSAYEMAPDRGTMERQATLLAMGETLDALCGLSDDGEEHHCPFCHKLPDAPRIAAPDDAARITRVIAHRLGHDLVVGPQDIRVHASPRAPPRHV